MIRFCLGQQMSAVEENRRNFFTAHRLLEYGFKSLLALRKIDHLQNKKRGTNFVPRSKFFVESTENSNQVAAVATAGASDEGASTAFGRSIT